MAVVVCSYGATADGSVVSRLLYERAKMALEPCIGLSITGDGRMGVTEPFLGIGQDALWAALPDTGSLILDVPASGHIDGARAFLGTVVRIFAKAGFRVHVVGVSRASVSASLRMAKDASKCRTASVAFSAFRSYLDDDEAAYAQVAATSRKVAAIGEGSGTIPHLRSRSRIVLDASDYRLADIAAGTLETVSAADRRTILGWAESIFSELLARGVIHGV